MQNSHPAGVAVFCIWWYPGRFECVSKPPGAASFPGAHTGKALDFVSRSPARESEMQTNLPSSSMQNSHPAGVAVSLHTVYPGRFECVSKPPGAASFLGAHTGKVLDFVSRSPARETKCKRILPSSSMQNSHPAGVAVFCIWWYPGRFECVSKPPGAASFPGAHTGKGLDFVSRSPREGNEMQTNTAQQLIIPRYSNIAYRFIKSSFQNERRIPTPVTSVTGSE